MSKVKNKIIINYIQNYIKEIVQIYITFVIGIIIGVILINNIKPEREERNRKLCKTIHTKYNTK